MTSWDVREDRAYAALFALAAAAITAVVLTLAGCALAVADDATEYVPGRPLDATVRDAPTFAEGERC